MYNIYIYICVGSLVNDTQQKKKKKKERKENRISQS